MLETYLHGLYQQTMANAYGRAHDLISNSLTSGEDSVLDCGASSGGMYETLEKRVGLEQSRYFGLEWNPELVARGELRGLNLKVGDLNKPLPYADKTFACVYGLSVIEHLLNPCAFLNQCLRVLKPEGTLILLTPNISTYFTALLILMGRMPSSGPHPDSNALLRQEEPMKVSAEWMKADAEGDTPTHRHLIIFSYRVLRRYLEMIGFRDVQGFGFGLYPFPNFLQPALQRFDPYHCHQMVFAARK